MKEMLIFWGKNPHLLNNLNGFKRKVCLIFYIVFVCLQGISRGALPHASQQGILHPYRTYSDVTLFYFTIPPELSRATWEFVAFMDSSTCPARDVHIFLQHGSFPVMNADNSTFPSTLYVGRSHLFATTTQASFRGVSSHHHGSFDHQRSMIAVYSPMPGDWFVAAYLSNWDQQLTQQGIGHRCHYSLFSVVLWSTDTNVEDVTPGVSLPLVTKRTFSYFKFYVPEGVQHLSVKVSDCEPLVEIPLGNSSSPCLTSLSLRASALPLLPSAPVSAHLKDPFEDNDVTEWGRVEPGDNATLTEIQPHTDTYYYLLLVSEVQAKFTLLVNVSACQKFDVRNGWRKLLNSGLLHRENNSMERSTTFQAEDYNSSSDDGVSPRDSNFSSKWLLATTNITYTNLAAHLTSASPNQMVVNWTLTTEEVSQSSTEVEDTLPLQNKTQNTSSCLRTFQLTRIQHSQDFSSTFLLQVDEFFISSLLLPDGEPVLVRLDVLPFLDIGGSLSIGLQLDRLLLTFFPSSHMLGVTACVRKGRPPPFPSSSGQPLSCPSELTLNLSSENRTSMETAMLVPFPEPGPWFIALQASCSANGSKVACISEELGLDLDIRIQPCVFAGDPCGTRGDCERTHHGLHTFSSCQCYGGFTGWGCTDGTGASPRSRQLMGFLFLTLSNLFFVPAVVLAAKRKLFAEALIYLATTFFSIIYHACDEPDYSLCVTRYEVLQFCDFFCSILAFWLTLISLARLPPALAAAAHMTGVLVVAVGVEWNRTALIVFLVPVALGLMVPVVAWSVRSRHAHNFVGLQKASILRLMPGVVLAAMGLGLFAMVETEANYQLVHSAWHMLMGLALLFLLPENNNWKPLSSPGARQRSNTPLLDASSQELCDVNDPVFVVPSSFQLLVTSES